RNRDTPTWAIHPVDTQRIRFVTLRERSATNPVGLTGVVDIRSPHGHSVARTRCSRRVTNSDSEGRIVAGGPAFRLRRRGIAGVGSERKSRASRVSRAAEPAGGWVFGPDRPTRRPCPD